MDLKNFYLVLKQVETFDKKSGGIVYLLYFRETIN